MFRNYTPITQLLEGLYVTEKSEPQSLIHRIEDRLKYVSQDEDQEEESCQNVKIDFDTRKINWDLKLRLSKRSLKLEKETMKQIAKYVKSQKNLRVNLK